jgi:hypothetical protein
MFVIFCGTFSSAVEAADDESTGCVVWDNLVQARKIADATAKAWHHVVIPPELEQKIERLLLEAMLNNPGMNMKTAYESVRNQLDAKEQIQIAPWFVAREARDAADAALKNASDEYTRASNEKDKALNEAQKAFEAEQAWLQSEKAAIQSMPRDGAYLDRVSRITQRLKSAYEKMKVDLDKHKGCFSDVRSFLDDKDERLKRIAILDAEIARRRGLAGDDNGSTSSGDADQAGTNTDGQAGNPANPGANPADANIQPNAATWSCAGPTVKVIRDTEKLLTSSDASGASWRVTSQDGQRVGDAKISITSPPKAKLTVGQAVSLTMTATAQPPAWANGMWTPGDFGGGQVFDGDGLYIDTPGGRMIATWHRQFIGHDPKMAPCFMRATIGRNIGNAVFDPEVQITWTYTLDGQK